MNKFQNEKYQCYTAKTVKCFLISFIFISMQFFSLSAQAQEKEKLSRFLNACLYGTATGALLGVASLAFVNDPAGSMNNITRGASLGLYAGIGIGLYMMDQETPSAVIIPKFEKQKLDGTEVLFLVGRF